MPFCAMTAVGPMPVISLSRISALDPALSTMMPVFW